jgi:hypothetical protein
MLGLATALVLNHTLANFTIELAISDFGKRIYTFFDAIINHYVINMALGLGMITAKVLLSY